MLAPPSRSALLALVVLAGCASGDVSRDGINDSLGPGAPAADDDSFETTGITTAGNDLETTSSGDTMGGDASAATSSPPPDDEGSTGAQGSDTSSATGSTSTAGVGETTSGETGTGDPQPGMVDLSGWTVVQTESDRTFTVPDGTVVPTGATIIICRGSTLAGFEAFWDVDLPAGTVFLSGDGDFPTINGDEVYTVHAPEQVGFDGPSLPMVVEGNAQRSDPASAPDSDPQAAWSQQTATVSSATPGDGPSWGPQPQGLYLSEISDAPGLGTYANEFVELRVF